MKNNNFGLAFTVLMSIGMFACAAGDTIQGSPGTGNTAGNSTGAGGNTGTGNVTGAAGTTGAGNVTGSAGRAGSGVAGTTGSGNVTGAAGTTGLAGTTGTGNVTGAAGTGVITGAAGTGVITGAAGATGTTCGAAFEIGADGFVKAPAAGGACWRGYAFAGGDAGSMIMPTTFSACGMPCMLRMMGTVGPATMANNYVGVAYLGFNLGQDATATTTPAISPTGTGVTVTFAATTGGLPLRAQITASGGTTFYCYTITGASPAMIPYSSFNTQCWDNLGMAYSKQPIQNIQLVVPGAATATAGVSVQMISVQEY